MYSYSSLFEGEGKWVAFALTLYVKIQLEKKPKTPSI